MNALHHQSFCSNHHLELENLIAYPQFIDRSKLKTIKLLILDVDGVMTDAGMFFTENGDQFKKYNAKDGMAIMALTKKDFQVGIISSGFKLEMVKSRAELLKIQHIYVGRDEKIGVLKEWCKKLDISLDNVAIIGDDINDLSIMNAVGFSACPADAVYRVKKTVDLVLSKKGGNACVREFIDHYLIRLQNGRKGVFPVPFHVNIPSTFKPWHKKSKDDMANKGFSNKFLFILFY